ncbi:COG4695 Phage-related protein [uncultured Caudovirales phage]|uniref:COG4695 Phage-related protein n=1 Tax=uncultured Caudovirales phage TaxID=2100421 RepID=A0A6J5M4L5_9CAUD|nr:COG4695 Phage-related protein [uncultured Caudovirales phage]
MTLLDNIKSLFGLSTQPAAAPGPLEDYWYSDAVLGVTGKSSLQSTAVFACVRVIAETIGTLPCIMYERLPDGGKRRAPEHPIYSVLHDQASANQTANEYWETVAAHIMGSGNSYSRIFYDARQNVSRLEPIEPQYVHVLVDAATGAKGYRVTELNRPTETLDDSRCLHIPGLSYDGVIGYSPIDAARRAVEMGMRAEAYADRVFRNGAIPPAYVSGSGAAPDAAAMKAFKEAWMRQNGGANQGSIGFLWNAEIKTVPINHRDLQFLELRKFQLEEIARIYRVPLHLVQSLDRSTNNNIEHQSLDFVTHTIRPWAVRLEKRINMALLGPRERQQYFAEFNLDALMRGDAESRASFYNSGISNGWMKPDEVRMRENLNPVGGAADRLYIQGAMLPLESAGQQMTAPQT